MKNKKFLKVKSFLFKEFKFPKSLFVESTEDGTEAFHIVNVAFFSYDKEEDCVDMSFYRNINPEDSAEISLALERKGIKFEIFQSIHPIFENGGIVGFTQGEEANDLFFKDIYREVKFQSSRMN